MKISVVTLVKNRKEAIINVIAGLENNSIMADELLIVHMNEATYNLESNKFVIREVTFNDDDKLPLARARNFAAQHSKYDYLVFLDADCIPDKDLLAVYRNAFENSDALYSGRIRYLTDKAMQQPNLLDCLFPNSLPDRVRHEIANYPYELFWSLNFGCHKDVFNTIGGFDEKFIGYGAEDTDFAFAARAADVELITLNAMAYHQYHPSYNPPLNHLHDIVCNAAVFKQKWELYPMTGWLKKFADLGYIFLEEDTITIIKEPTEQAIAQCLKDF